MSTHRCVQASVLIYACLSVSALALTPKERKIVEHAKADLEAAIRSGEELKQQLHDAEIAGGDADQAAADAEASAAQANERAITAEAQAKKEHDELVRAATENEKMRPIVKEVNKWWGIGAIIYGFKRLSVHLLILAAVIVVLAIAASLLERVFPWLAPIGSLVRGVGKKILSLFQKKKPPTT